MSLGPITGGTLYGVGVGPGERDYLTLRAVAVIRAADVVAFFAKKGGAGTARTIVGDLVPKGRRELPLHYPMTTERPPHDPVYREELAAFYEAACAQLADELSAGRSVAVLAEGDPFFYGSFMHLWRRLVGRFPVEIVPGVTGMSGCWTRAGVPITWGDDALAVLPATLPAERLTAKLRDADAAVVMKLGRNLPKVRRALAEAGLTERAVYVERGTMHGERVLPLSEKEDDEAPYFSVVLVPGEGRRP
ncbi:precorrin-2 C(20)-methyltransferase [Chelatococcus sp. SYSU_G07232]|uniref:Precorrin-2 C(20)-methyltransferase n=1 Tax=Chelatococcus albus TaxID=3047466 RepID=A0ABT7AHI2_9HYPH|nr:precorrin-2 C(20)-methyltransferase [Chelatococcus sp. SYSU_G07232]MDJ1158837.1 precorrin-2 C(20)-methyltransferase [Chelatococcus sp. SYSU_G07232]